MNNKALFKISYGLYVLSAKENGVNNGCIVNTLSQITDNPLRISVTVNKLNFTHDMIKRTRKFSASILAESAPFGIFQSFGFRSGKDVQKFEGFTTAEDKNGIFHLTEHCTGFISGKVFEEYDLGTHTTFIADVIDADVLSDENSMTYAYYHKFVKPAASDKKPTLKGWRCTICGYVYEGEELPDDFICPLCKHGVSDFVPIEAEASL